MTVETLGANSWPFLTGSYLLASLPNPALFPQMMAYVTDVDGGVYMLSNGTAWGAISDKRTETYSGTTDASGNYSVVYATPYSTTPNVQPVTSPPASSTTRVRLTASTQTGFTVKTETNAGVNVLGIDVLLLATSNVPSVPVRVLVVES